MNNEQQRSNILTHSGSSLDAHRLRTAGAEQLLRRPRYHWLPDSQARASLGTESPQARVSQARYRVSRAVPRQAVPRQLGQYPVRPVPYS